MTLLYLLIADLVAFALAGRDNLPRSPIIRYLPGSGFYALLRRTLR